LLMRYSSKIKEILKLKWSEYETKCSKAIRECEREAVTKVLGCGDPKNGFAEYWCLDCGKEKKIVPFTCKSRFCPSCGKVYTDKWVEKMSKEMVDVPHRHVVMTVARELRPYFYWKRELLPILINSAAQVMKSIINGKKNNRDLTPGIVIVVHTFGRDLKFNPHIHALMTEGGLDKNGDWKPIDFLPYAALRKRWQHLILKAFRESFKDNKKVINLVNKLYTQKKDGFYVHARTKMRSARSAAKYIGRYMSRPAIAESRIIRWDDKEVEFWYEDSETGKKQKVRLPILQFIGRLVSHIPEKQFKMVRHYGIYARNKRFECRLAVKFWQIEKLLQEKKIHGFEGKSPTYKKINYRERMIKEFGSDPCKCPRCGSEMELVKIWHPKYGDIYDLFSEGVEVVDYGKRQKNKKEKGKAICKTGGNGDLSLFAV
jgi:transposase-like protein